MFTSLWWSGCCGTRDAEAKEADQRQEELKSFICPAKPRKTKVTIDLPIAELHEDSGSEEGLSQQKRLRRSSVGYEIVRRIKEIRANLAELQRRIFEAELHLIGLPDKNKSVSDIQNERKFTLELTHLKAQKDALELEIQKIRDQKGKKKVR